MPDDAELLRSYLDERSESSFSALVQRHMNLVYFTALRAVNGDTHLAEDVTQRVFTKFVAKAISLAGRSSLAGWFYLTTRFEASHAVRAERRRHLRETEAQIMHETLLDPESAIEWERLRWVVDDILCALSEKDREVILLRFFQGTPFAEMGARLGITADAARFRVERALEKTRSALGRRGIVSTSAALSVALGGQAEAMAPAGLMSAVVNASWMSTGATGTSLTGLLQFMSTSKLIVGAAVLVGFLGIGFSWHEQTANRKARAAIAEANREFASLNAQIQEGKRAVLKSRQQIDLLQSQLVEHQGRPAKSRSGAVLAKAKTAGSSPPDESKGPPVNRELSNNPQVRAELVAWMTAVQNNIYGPLYKSLGLSSAQVDSLNKLMLQYNINLAGAVLTTRPEDVTVPQVQQQIHDLLGDADYQQFSQYQKTQFVRTVANGLASNLYYTPTPLSSQQSEQLTQIFAQNSSPTLASGMPFPGEVNWDSVLTQAQGVLSAPQYAALQNEVTLISSQKGMWGGMFSPGLMPGAMGDSPTPPPVFYASRLPVK